MKLSSRLQMVANQITEGMIVADIGTDHGYIPIYQIVNNLSPMGYACDVNEGPLKRALENVNLYGVREKITLLLSNGLAVFEKGEYKDNSPESIVIAGMGGALINRIIAEGINTANNAKELILSPHSEIPEVRKFLYNNGWVIIAEDMVKEDGKFYTVIKAVKKTELLNENTECHAKYCTDYEVADEGSELSEVEYTYGRLLLSEKHKVLYEYLKKEEDTNNRILCNLKENGGSSSISRITEIEEKQDIVRKALISFGIME